MLEARRISMWRSRYALTQDGQPVATWDGRLWRTGGTFALGDRTYDVGANVWGTRFQMADEFGTIVAAADRVGRKRWTVEASGRTYEFARASMWRSQEVLLVDGSPAGSVRRVSHWRGDAVADLPGLSLALQVFVLVTVLTMWDARAAAASG